MRWECPPERGAGLHNLWRGAVWPVHVQHGCQHRLSKAASSRLCSDSCILCTNLVLLQALEEQLLHACRVRGLLGI